MLRRIVLESLRVARRGAAAVTGVSIAMLRRLNQALADGDTPLDPAAAVRELRRILGLPVADTESVDDTDGGADMTAEEQLRERFAVLLARSQSPDPPSGAHPAMERIVGELSPDEARILRLLREEGPQPIITVRAAPYLGRGEETVLDHASLVADRAGCHRADEAPAYLDNLTRLGLVRQLSEELPGHEDYDVIASRPEVVAVVEQVTDERSQRARMDRGHVRLSDLGSLLCDICLA